MKASSRWRGKYCFASRGEQITEGAQRQSHLWISLEFSLVAKYNTRFIKKFSQLNSDIQSYRCNKYQVWWRGSGPPTPTLLLDPPLFWCPLISFLQHSVIRTNQLLATDARSELETPGADPGFFLGGGALVSCSTSTPINHIVFFSQNTSCIRKPQVISGGKGAHPLHPPPRSAPEHNHYKQQIK